MLVLGALPTTASAQGEGVVGRAHDYLHRVRQVGKVGDPSGARELVAERHGKPADAGFQGPAVEERVHRWVGEEELEQRRPGLGVHPEFGQRPADQSPGDRRQFLDPLPLGVVGMTIR